MTGLACNQKREHTIESFSIHNTQHKKSTKQNEQQQRRQRQVHRDTRRVSVCVVVGTSAHKDGD